ncbi:Uncharacterised protein [Mycoplasmopsis citelli]|uniref:Uncharacterized protein n=1 Tax=Mycoplasmopsis citelli TaxID=171281 RepID=A0A449B205_9BACT|nr:hypothetical protein [Mycoplasmopsis citelli]VEU74601.1 Uncharacterised protein [Mycoplasmopsis citelli]
MIDFSYLKSIIIIIDIGMIIYSIVNLSFLWWLKIENTLVEISFQKTDFVLLNKSKVHPFFLAGIESVILIVKNSNKKLIYQKMPDFLFFIFFVILFRINGFNQSALEFTHLFLFIIWAFFGSLMLVLIFLRNMKINKLLKVSKKIIVNKQAPLFNLKISADPNEILYHSGAVANIENFNWSSSSITNDKNLIDSSTNYENYKINIEKLLLNRDILSYKLNGNKQQARYIHYLMVAYSDDEMQEFYNPLYEDNIKYFLELEQYYSN